MTASGTHIFKTALFLQHGENHQGASKSKGEVSRTDSLTGRELAALKLASAQLLHQERAKLLYAQKILDLYGSKCNTLCNPSQRLPPISQDGRVHFMRDS